MNSSGQRLMGWLYKLNSLNKEKLMTYHNLMPLALKDFDKFFVGFDEQFNRMVKIREDLSKVPNYPPYNIKRTAEDKYVVEMAVAGFNQTDISIEVADGHLIVVGKAEATTSEDAYLFKGISNRSFTRTLTLGEHIEVKNAEMSNGMLTIFLERVIPEHKKPKKIAITNLNEPQLLNE